MKYLFLIFTILLSVSSYAYIAPYWMIMSRTSDNHGKGLYLVEQNVSFHHGDEPLLITERWIIESENSLRLEVVGRGKLKDELKLTYVYQNNKRYFVDTDGVLRQTKIPIDFFEPYFHFRLSKNIKPMLVAQNIAPAVSLKSAPHSYSKNKPNAEPEPYVRLARVGGTVSYAVGSPTPPSSSVGSPGIWIEQDLFDVRKIRFSSLLEITAHNYKQYGNGLRLPEERLITWDKYTAKINLNEVKVISASGTVKDSLSYASLNFGNNPNIITLIPADDVIKKFYSQMR